MEGHSVPVKDVPTGKGNGYAFLTLGERRQHEGPSIGSQDLIADEESNEKQEGRGEPLLQEAKPLALPAAFVRLVHVY